MLITLRSAWAAPPVVHDVTWEQVRELFHANAALTYAPNADHKLKPLDLPLICFAAFEGSYKRTDLRSGLHALALDYDDTPAGHFERVLARFRQNEQRGLAHTTWKHGTCNPSLQPTVRARIIIPFADELELTNWDLIWANSADLYYADGLDEQCKNPERCYYLPATNPNAPWPCWVESW